MEFRGGGGGGGGERREKKCSEILLKNLKEVLDPLYKVFYMKQILNDLHITQRKRKSWSWNNGVWS